jgi:type I restriction enzyme R subunit
LERLGYQYISPDTLTPTLSQSEKGYKVYLPLGETEERVTFSERKSYGDVLLTDRLRNAVRRINPAIPADSQEEALKEIQRINSPELLVNNEKFHRMLTEGIPVTKVVYGDERGDRVWLIDFENPENNEFIVANQFTVVENGNNKRPDVILFVNGIPLVVIELKNPADENATVRSAYRQLQTYKEIIPILFTYIWFYGYL